MLERFPCQGRFCRAGQLSGIGVTKVTKVNGGEEEFSSDTVVSTDEYAML